MTAGLDEPAAPGPRSTAPVALSSRSRSPSSRARAARQGPESVQAAQFGKMLVPGLGPHRVGGEDGPPRHVGVRTVPRGISPVTL